MKGHMKNTEKNMMYHTSYFFSGNSFKIQYNVNQSHFTEIVLLFGFESPTKCW